MSRFYHSDFVSVFTPQGEFICHGLISSRYGLEPEHYDVQPVDHPSLKARMINVKAADIRKHYVAPHMVKNEPLHIKDYL
jgi:hypothetical protein